MAWTEIDVKKENLNPFTALDDKWFLLTAGTQEGFNMMTCSWGFMGIIWHKPVFVTVVRPQRYTKTFMDQNEYFTISFYGDEYKKALGFCGAHSGKDVNKVEKTGLTPVFQEHTVFFEEAELVLFAKAVCQQLEEDKFIDASKLENYANKDFHFAYYGEIVKAYKKA